MIASVRGPGRRGRRRTARWSRSAGSAWPCPARPARWPGCGSAAGPAGHQPGGPGGLADPLRLRRRRRARRCSSCCRPPAGSGRGWPRRCSRCTPPDVVRRAIATGDITTLTRVPGIGKKGAERLVLELRDRIGPVGAGAGGAAVAARSAPWQDQVRQALVGLGWTAAPGRAGGRPRSRRDVDGEPAPACRCCSSGRSSCWARDDAIRRARSAREAAMTRRRRGLARTPDDEERDAEASAAAAPAGRVHRPAPGPRAARPAAAGRDAPRPPPDHILLSGPPGLGKTTPGHDRRGRAGRRACGSPAARRSSAPATWPRC